MAISSFKTYLVEEEKTLYFVWGRMNPPTAGHEKLLDFLKEKAGNNPFRIYLTQTEDDEKNPIPYNQKIKFARKGFPRYARQIMVNRKLKTLFDAMTSFYNEGFKKVVIVAGSDRVREYDILLNKYNGKKGRHGLYNFENISVENAGDRDPESKKVDGVSGTKLRGFAEKGDFTKFAQYMPKDLSNADAKNVFNAVRKGLGLKEQKDFKNRIKLSPVSQEREAYVTGDLYEIDDTVVVKESGEVGRVKHLGTNYIIVETKNGDFRKWLDAVELIEAEDPDIGHMKGVQSKGYYKGLKKTTKKSRAAHFNKNKNKDDDDASAYKPAPGDAKAKTKPSKHTKKFKQMFGELQTDEEDNPRIPRKKGQPAGSDKHSDLYTDENPKGTIHGLKFATVEDAKASVAKIEKSGKKHAHKIQAAIAMEQRARVMGKTGPADVYRAYINKMKKKTKEMNEFKQMYGEQDQVDMAKKRIARQKASMDKRHDRMMDRARMRDVKKKNRETRP